VLKDNLPAQQLYHSMGFEVSQGTPWPSFRVQGFLCFLSARLFGLRARLLRASENGVLCKESTLKGPPFAINNPQERVCEKAFATLPPLCSPQVIEGAEHRSLETNPELLLMKCRD